MLINNQNESLKALQLLNLTMAFSTLTMASQCSFIINYIETNEKKLVNFFSMKISFQILNCVHTFNLKYFDYPLTSAEY